MQRSDHTSRQQSGRGAVLSAPGVRRWLAGAGWLLLLLGSALALAPQLGCHSPQNVDGAGGQSGDEGRRGLASAPPAPHRARAPH